MEVFLERSFLKEKEKKKMVHKGRYAFQSTYAPAFLPIRTLDTEARGAVILDCEVMEVRLVMTEEKAEDSGVLMTLWTLHATPCITYFYISFT